MFLVGGDRMDLFQLCCVVLIVYSVLISVMEIIFTVANKLKKTQRGLYGGILTALGMGVSFCMKSYMIESVYSMISICLIISAIISILIGAWGIISYD